MVLPRISVICFLRDIPNSKSKRMIIVKIYMLRLRLANESVHKRSQMQKPVHLEDFFFLFLVTMSSAKEKFLKYNTLSCLVGQCVGHVTTVELRNEAFVTGKVLEVDGFMYVIFQFKKCSSKTWADLHKSYFLVLIRV